MEDWVTEVFFSGPKQTVNPGQDPLQGKTYYFVNFQFNQKCSHPSGFAVFVVLRGYKNHWSKWTYV